MKRYGNLYEKVISLDNLWLADEKTRQHKGNSYGIRVHDRHRMENLMKLHDLLITHEYRTSKYDIFTIHEPKERIIYRLPYFPDRIVHHAIMNILEPMFVKVFTYNTYSCIKGRGIEGCDRRVEAIIKSYEGRPLYCLKIDIKKFYPSIDHDVLKRLVRRKIKDKDLLQLIDEIIDSADGLPIGNYLSQYLANLYLAWMMHKVNECYKELFATCTKVECTEYADDICFFADNKAVLHRVIVWLQGYVTNELKLRIKDNWNIFPIAKNRYDRHGRALDYVGYKFYREQKLLRKSIKRKLCRKVASLNAKEKPIEPKEFKRQVSPWLGWCKYSNSRHLLKSIINSKYYDSIL